MMLLKTSDTSFADQFSKLMHLRDSHDHDVSDTVRDIVQDVRENGDSAVIHLTEQLDHVELTSKTMRLDTQRISTYANQCEPDVRSALEIAAARIFDYHEKQKPQDLHYTDDTGTTLGWKWTAIEAVGLYVPGGLATYPSSVLMNAIPARAAGCERLVMCVPTPNGDINPAVVAAAQIADIDEIYTIGGAQAIAAMAYGTETITPVYKIVGPGNSYVAEAKRQVFGKVGIDTIAGPSEILVVADAENDPKWIAADLLSQAEHDPVARAILITDDESFAVQVAKAIQETLQIISRRDIAHSSWDNYGAVIIVNDWEEAATIINQLAPEHLELALSDPEPIASMVRNAGAIFLGRFTPEAVGDYIAGPSHVLPTSQAAKFSSGLNVLDFMKRSSLINCSQNSLKAIYKQAATIADSEGLGAHALSLRIRNS